MRFCFVFLLGSVVIVGCGRSRLVSPAPDAGVDAPFDSAIDARRTDVGLDAPPLDSGADAGTSEELLSQLTCGLTEEQVLLAIARYVGCNTDEEVTMAMLLEAWEGFVLGAPDPFPGALANIPMGCDIWQCYGRERVCRDARICIADQALERGCEIGETRCIDGHVTSCFDNSMLSIVNCTVFDSTCVDDHCVSPEGCEFGPFRELGCVDGDIHLCDETLSCAEFNGGSCSSFAVMGEVPTTWCSPTGEPAAGAYRTEVDCEEDTGFVNFTTVAGTEITFDCMANGFRRCSDERGCVR